MLSQLDGINCLRLVYNAFYSVSFPFSTEIDKFQYTGKNDEQYSERWGRIAISIFSDRSIQQTQTNALRGRITHSDCLKGFYFGDIAKEKRSFFFSKIRFKNIYTELRGGGAGGRGWGGAGGRGVGRGTVDGDV